MPDALYERDIRAWSGSEQQVKLLRRLAARERLNEAVDWSNVIEEVDSVGLVELQACRSLLRQALVHLLNLSAEPDALSAPHWRGEVVSLLADAFDRYSPSMRRNLEMQPLWDAAIRQVRAEGGPSRAAPPCPLTFDDLLTGTPEVTRLVDRLR